MITTRLYRTIILTSIVVLTIYFANSVVMPIIFSAFCAMFAHPLVKRFENIGIPLVISSVIVVLLLAATLGVIISFFIVRGTEIATDLPTMGMKEVLDNPVSAIDKKVDLDLNNFQNQIVNVIESTKSKLLSFIPETIININNALIFIITCPIYIFFMLISRSSIRSFYYTSFKQQNQKRANDILSEIETLYIKYLKGLGYVMLIVAFLTGLGLYLLGVKYAIFIGILTGFLTLIPYIGVIISAAIPVIIALLTMDSLWYAGGVIGIFIFVQFLEGNIITPKIMGNQVDVNPLMVIIGIVIFGSIGGIVGMILTIPVLALLKIIAKHIPGWKPLESLLSA